MLQANVFHVGAAMKGRKFLPVPPLLVLAGALCFSTTGFTQALVVPYGATPLSIGGMRMAIGALGMLLFCAVRGRLPKLAGWPLRELLASTLGILGFQVFFFLGTLHAGVTAGTLTALGASPVAAAVIGFLFFRERPPLAWYPSTVLAAAGILLMGWGSGCEARGLAYALAAGAAYGMYLAFSRRLAERHAPEEILCMVLALCALCFVPVLFACPPSWVLSLPGMIAAAHLGLVTTTAAYLLMLCGMRGTGAPVAATLGLAEPVCATLLAFFFLGEPLSLLSALGILCVMASALVIFVFPARS